MTRTDRNRYTDTLDVLDLVEAFYGDQRYYIIHDLAVDKNQIAIIDVEFLEGYDEEDRSTGRSDRFKQNIPCLVKVDQDE